MRHPATATRPFEVVTRMDPLLLVLRASLLVVLANSHEDTLLFVAVAAVSVVLLPRPALLTSPWTWGAGFLLIGGRQLLDWHALDDHVVVTTYWCGAIALALTAADQRATLAASARFLVGAIFACAVGWKLLSPEFVDGTFFRWSLLFDERFETVARMVGGTSEAAHRANLDDARDLALGASSQAVLQEGPRNAALAHVFTWWGVAIESAVAIAFLAPLRRRAAWVRHAALTAFATTTYLTVPVSGFGTVLLVLGAAQAVTPRGRLAYLWGALAMLAWSRIWPVFFL